MESNPSELFVAAAVAELGTVWLVWLPCTDWSFWAVWLLCTATGWFIVTELFVAAAVAELGTVWLVWLPCTDWSFWAVWLLCTAAGWFIVTESLELSTWFVWLTLVVWTSWLLSIVVSAWTVQAPIPPSKVIVVAVKVATIQFFPALYIFLCSLVILDTSFCN